MWRRLPVTSLLRFKSSVSKSSCRALTSFSVDRQTTTSSSSKFGTFILQQANLHTTTTTSSSSKFGTFIFQATEPSDYNKYEDDVKLYMLSSSGSGSGSGDGDGDGDGEDDDNNEDEDDQKKKMVFKLDDLGFLPFYKDFLLEDSLRMVGSCNGIICLHDPELLDGSNGIRRQHYSHLRDVSLWNPATREFRILPKSIPIEERDPWVRDDSVAFGFDVKTKDYKVLRITSWAWDYRKESGGCMCRVQVYSLSTDSWRLLDGINSLPVVPAHDIHRNHGIYLNGSYFFVGRKPNRTCGTDDSMLLSFDFTKEIFNTMQLPNDNSNSSTVLSCMGDKMAIFTTPPIDYTGGYWYYDIWVLNEQHGSSSGNNVVVNKESWTKLHSFRIKNRYHTEPRCISNNGEFALISTITDDDGYSTETDDDDDDGYLTEKLQLFNLVTKETKKDFLIGTQVCRADVYEESLVSIMGGGNVLLRWQLPTVHGTTCYKLNLDAPFIESCRAFGIGLCLTSEKTGGCIGVRSLRRQVRDAVEGEAMAVLEAIKWAKKLELSPIIIESDSKNCVSFFMEDDNNSPYWSSGEHSLLWEAKFLLDSSELDISFQHCSRNCNYVADIAAKLGREGLTWTCKDWTANFPGEIVMSLSKDLGLETW